MKSKLKWRSILLFGLALLLTGSVITCQPTPAPTPTPTPTPTPSVPSASLAEVAIASEVDSLNTPIKTASVFTDDTSTIHCCAKLCNAPANTRIKAEWIYRGGERADLLNCVLYDHSLIESGTCRLRFSQNKPFSGWALGDYEVVLYLNGEQNSVVAFSIIEAPPPPPEPEVKELLVDWVVAEYSGTGYHIEGSVTNLGTVPLHNIQVEFVFYIDGAPIVTKTTPLYPSTIAVSETAHFRLEFGQVKRLKTYTYRFLSASGELINYRESD